MTSTSGSRTPRVSVIVIFLNAAEFIEESIRSVMAQTFEEWELLLVDDGSSDESTSIARGYAEIDSARFRYLEHGGHANRGMSASRNLGIAEARGEFIAFLDADDVWLPDKLHKQVEMLEANPRAAMVYGPTLLWYSWDSTRVDPPSDRLRRLGVPPHRVHEPPSLVPRFLRREAQTPSTCGVLVRLEAVRRVGGFEDVFRGMYEDQVFFYKLCLHEPVYVTDQCWDWYRQHRASASARSEMAGFYSGTGASEAHRQFLEWVRRYVQQEDAMDDSIRDALDAAYWPYRHPVLFAISQFLSRAPSKAKRRLYRFLGIGQSTPS